MKILYFTGTGNSLHVAKEIGGQLYSIPELIENKEYELSDDKIGIIFPCYLYGMPRIVEKFLKKLKINAEYVFIIVTMGSKDKGTLNSCEKLLNKNNIKVNYTNHIAMVDNYVPLYDTENELKIKNKEKIQEDIEKIVTDINGNRNFKIENSKIDKFLTNITRSIRNNFIAPRGDYFIFANEQCNKCQLCIKHCPLKNIEIKESKIKFKHNCESCMRCVHICPKNAIHVKGEKSDKRYVNEHIKIKELN